VAGVQQRDVSLPGTVFVPESNLGQVLGRWAPASIRVAGRREQPRVESKDVEAPTRALDWSTDEGSLEGSNRS